MRTEKEKMLAGELYDPLDAVLADERRRARLLLKAFNDTPDDAAEERVRLLRALLPRAGANLWIEPPFFCDYGSNIALGERVFFNVGCVVLDVAEVVVGDRVLFGPGVHVYAATHPLDARTRAAGLELGKPVHVGDDAWIGGGAILCPGVRVGARTVVAAGSVVTRDLPADVLAAGNPCRILRPIVQADTEGL